MAAFTWDKKAYQELIEKMMLDRSTILDHYSSHPDFTKCDTPQKIVNKLSNRIKVLWQNNIECLPVPRKPKSGAITFDVSDFKDMKFSADQKKTIADKMASVI